MNPSMEATLGEDGRGERMVVNGSLGPVCIGDCFFLISAPAELGRAWSLFSWLK